MIKYRLKCENCNKTFDSWFSSSSKFEKLKKKNFLNCHFCNSKSITKTLMAPSIISLKNNKDNKIKKRILEFQKFINYNFEDVGDDFAYKARSIHYTSKKRSKGIYGSATKKQINELREEGIETQIFPWIEDNNN